MSGSLSSSFVFGYGYESLHTKTHLSNQLLTMKTRSCVSVVPCLPDEGSRLYRSCSLCSYYLQREFTYAILVIIYANINLLGLQACDAG